MPRSSCLTRRSACTLPTPRGPSGTPALPGSRKPCLDEDDVCPYIGSVKIEWDPKKAEANLKAHGVAFAEAATVFTDDQALTREDPDSVDEQRFVSLGLSATGSLLVLVYTHREPDVYRLISSWKANKPQRTQYEKSRR